MIPKIDSQVGIKVYSTSNPGCGGKIKIHKDDFKVSEILSKKAISSISQEYGYPVYKLRKNGIDTFHALDAAFKNHGLRLKSFGLKDAFAETEQLVSATKKSELIKNISGNRYSLEGMGYVKKPFTKKDMVGNHFEIKIIDPEKEISNFKEFDKILNFYGYQRFGSRRPVTHLVGKALLQKDYGQAVHLLLSFTSEYDSQENNELRGKLSDVSNYSRLVEEMPKQMDIEILILQEMISSNDPQKAIRSLPLSLRRLFIQAYQSFLFNLTLSSVYDYGEDLYSCRDGDVCFDKESKIGKFTNGIDQRLAIPIVGYAYYKKTRFDNQISKILNEEEISPRDFFIKEMQEISSEGGFRNSAVNCSDFYLSRNTVSFTLSRGSYATIVLREIMKPVDPLSAGF